MKKRFIEDPDRFVLLNPDAIILHKKISKNILDDNISDQKQNSSYLSDAFETIKQNYKCPKGTVDDTNACGLEGQPNKSSETFIGFKADHDFSSKK